MEPSWDLYRALLAVLREGSLSGAARALGLTQPTLGRQIQALEAALGLPLFTRSPHGLRPNEAALRLRIHAEALEASAASLLRAARDSEAEVAGSVRVTASEVVGAEWLPTILSGLQQAHPALVIELVLSNRIEDLLRREADIAVRMTRPVQAALLARRLGTVEIGLHARPDYLARRGVPADLASLRGHAVIGFDRGSAFVRSLMADGPGLDPSLFTLRTDNDLAHLAAIRAGAGIGICQVPLARRDGLSRVLADALSIPLEMWVAMHEDLARSRRCRTVFDALVDGLAGALAGRPVRASDEGTG